MSTNRLEIIHFTERVNLCMLTPHGRSGSVFFQALMDGHPNVFSVPGLLRHYKYWSRAKSDLSKALDLFILNNPGLFDIYTAMQEHGDIDPALESSQKLSRREFKERGVEIGNSWAPQNDKDFLLLIHMAFAGMLQQDLSKVQWLLVHFHNYENDFRMDADTVLQDDSNNHEALCRDLPRCKMIAMSRHPSESYYSFRLLYKDASLFFYLANNAAVLKCFQSLQTIIHRIGRENIIILDLNALHSTPEKTLTEVCQFLGIPLHPSLWHATLLGHPWYGRSSTLQASDTFHPDRARLRYNNDLTDPVPKAYLRFIAILFSAIPGHELYFETQPIPTSREVLGQFTRFFLAIFFEREVIRSLGDARRVINKKRVEVILLRRLYKIYSSLRHPQISA